MPGPVTCVDGLPSWATAANCSGIASYLFTSQNASLIDEAKAVCGGCVVRDECLAFASANGIVDGIWGGRTAPERSPAPAGGGVGHAVHPSGAAGGATRVVCFAS